MWDYGASINGSILAMRLLTVIGIMDRPLPVIGELWRPRKILGLWLVDSGGLSQSRRMISGPGLSREDAVAEFPCPDMIRDSVNNLSWAWWETVAINHNNRYSLQKRAFYCIMHDQVDDEGTKKIDCHKSMWEIRAEIIQLKYTVKFITTIKPFSLFI